MRQILESTHGPGTVIVTLQIHRIKDGVRLDFVSPGFGADEPSTAEAMCRVLGDVAVDLIKAADPALLRDCRQSSGVDPALPRQTQNPDVA